MIDAGVPATAVVRMPERDADSIPRSASSPGAGGLKSRTGSVLRLLRIGRRGWYRAHTGAEGARPAACALSPCAP
ncbi:hypothetical protein [Streptomyces sp. NPDC056227]|uniref:hypothetical protein n=1 Tax=Streptomyces sp. NPDC056227 TaxID=3345753 RepID=UPI0035D951D9